MFAQYFVTTSFLALGLLVTSVACTTEDSEDFDESVYKECAVEENVENNVESTEFIPCMISMITDDQGFRNAGYEYMDVAEACDNAYSRGDQVEQCIVNVCKAYGCEGAGCGNLCE